MFDKFCKNFFITLGIVLNINYSYAQWIIEDENKQNPIEKNEETLEEGKKLFQQNCAMCHGLGSGNQLDPMNKSYHQQKNANLFFKTKNGGGFGMPPFGSSLKENQIWSIVLFFKSLGDKFNGKNTKIELQYNEKNTVIKAIVTVEDTFGNKIAVKNAKIGFLVKRTFGKLNLKPNIKTNQNGVARAKLPKDLPGDENGKLNVEVKLMNEFKFGEVSSNIHLKTIPLKSDNILKNRTLWNTGAKIPFWLLTLYCGITVGVWASISYVIILIIRIKKHS